MEYEEKILKADFITKIKAITKKNDFDFNTLFKRFEDHIGKFNWGVFCKMHLQLNCDMGYWFQELNDIITDFLNNEKIEY